MTANPRLPRYLRVTSLLRSEVQSGAFGDRLPAENELATKYRISRMTLRRALAALAEEGLLDPRQGAGTFVREGAGQARTVAFVVAPDMMAHPDDPYHQQVVVALMYACAARGWMLRISPSATDLGSRFSAGRGASVSACIAVGFGGHDHGLLADIPIPVVGVDGEPLSGSPSVLPDNAAGTASAVDRLIALGHREIAHVAGNSDKLAGRERLAAFLTAMSRAGISVRDGAIQPSTFLVEDGYHAMATWWKSSVRPTAVVCANDMIAIGAARWAVDHGIQVGREVSLIGCDGLAISGLMTPGISTLSMDFAAHAANALDAVADSERGGIRRTPLKLIERASMGPVPTG
jgi:DNA-binding LacI/PurR family transcriptional regulator